MLSSKAAAGDQLVHCFEGLGTQYGAAFFAETRTCC